MTNKTRPLNPQYFRDQAEILGCTNVKELSDWEVWNYILRAQGKPELQY